MAGKTFRGRPLVHSELDLEQFKLKAHLIQIDKENKKVEHLHELSKVVECEYKSWPKEADKDAEKVEHNAPLHHAAIKLDKIYSILK